MDLELCHVISGKFPFPEESFDKVLCINVLEFADDPETLVKEMIRVLKKSGELILGVLNKSSVWGLTNGVKKSFAKGAYYEAKFYSPEELSKLLSDLNVEAVSTHLFFPPINNKEILRASNVLETIGSKFFKYNGALIVVKAVKP